MLYDKKIDYERIYERIMESAHRQGRLCYGASGSELYPSHPT